MDEFAQLSAEFEDLRTSDSTRLERYKQYRQENEAARDDPDMALRSVAATGGDYGLHRDSDNRTLRHKIPLPFGIALTVKHSYRISGRLPDAVVDRREESPQERYRSDTMEKIWWSMVHDSGEETLFAEGAWDGSQLGASCFDVYFDPSTQKPIFRCLDPAGVIVVRGVEEVHDFERVFRYWSAPTSSVKAQYRNFDFDGSGTYITDVSELESDHKVGTVPMTTLVECGSRQSRYRFALGGESGATPLYKRAHGLGFVPYVVIPNIGPYRDVWGWADYEFVRALCHYIPALLGREADILKMVAGGAYTGSGVGQDADTVKRVIAEGGYLPKKRDGSIEPIDPPQVPAFAESHSDRVVEFLKMLGFAPDASWGGSDTRSGVDRALQLQPLLELTAMKQTNWSRGLSRLASYAFRMLEDKQITGQAATFRGYKPGTTSAQRTAFKAFQLGPDMTGVRETATLTDPATGEEYDDDVILPRSPKELFGGDYGIRFVWQNRIDPDDPAYVLAELNKFAQGVQSLRTTLERLGFQAPEDEIRLIEQEAEKYPWLRQGMIALMKLQLMQASGGGGGQGSGGGNPGDPLADLASGLGMMGGSDGDSEGANALTSGLPGATGQLYGG